MHQLRLVIHEACCEPHRSAWVASLTLGSAFRSGHSIRSTHSSRSLVLSSLCNFRTALFMSGMDHSRSVMTLLFFVGGAV